MPTEIFKVRSIENVPGRLTAGKLYNAVADAGLYKLQPDDGGKCRSYYKERFELVAAGDSTQATTFGPITPPTAPTARKDDSGKLDMTLLDDMPRAIEAVVEVMQWAITKKEPTPYQRGSWLGVSADRYRAAVLRHLSGAAKQQSVPGAVFSVNLQRDDETKLLHLAHAACSALMALENTLREIEQTKKGN